jgi:hypothetical protein
MGGFVGQLGNALTTIGKAVDFAADPQYAHQQNLIRLQDMANTHTAMFKLANELANNPALDPQTAEQYRNLAVQIAGTPTTKFNPKKFDLQAPIIDYQKRQQMAAAAGAPASINGQADRIPQQNFGVIPPPPGQQAQVPVPGLTYNAGGFEPGPSDMRAFDWRRGIGVEAARERAIESEKNRAELERQKALAAYQLELGQQRVKALEDSGIEVPDTLKAFMLTGVPMTGMGSLMRPVFDPNTVSGAMAPPGTLDYFGKPVDPNLSYKLQINNLTGAAVWIPAEVTLRTGTTAEGNVVQYNPRKAGSAAAAGVVAPSMANPRQFTGQNGDVLLASPAQIAAGQAPTPVPGAVNPSFAPTTTVTDIPGQLPQTRVTQKGRAGAAPAAGGGVVSGGNRPIPKSIDTTIVGRKYQDWVSGGPAPTGRELTAVQAYAAKNGLPTPVQLSAAGQQNLQAVDAVFREIDDISRILDRIKGDPYLGLDYEKYRLGISTPYDELFTKLSFEGLRSAAAALKGNNSRAYPIIARAFEHVPQLDRMGGLKPDSISVMKDKLRAMRDVLADTRDTVLQDERKSGTVSSPSPPPGRVAPIQLKDGRILMPHSQAEAEAFRREHPDLIK